MDRDHANDIWIIITIPRRKSTGVRRGMGNFSLDNEKLHPKPLINQLVKSRNSRQCKRLVYRFPT